MWRGWGRAEGTQYFFQKRLRAGPGVRGVECRAWGEGTASSGPAAGWPRAGLRRQPEPRPQGPCPKSRACIPHAPSTVPGTAGPWVGAGWWPPSSLCPWRLALETVALETVALEKMPGHHPVSTRLLREAPVPPPLSSPTLGRLQLFGQMQRKKRPLHKEP